MPRLHACSRVVHAGGNIGWVVTLSELLLSNEAKSLELRARRRNEFDVVIEEREVDQAKALVVSLIYWRCEDSMDRRFDVALVT